VRRFREAQGASTPEAQLAASVTPAIAADFLSELAESGALKSATLRTYRSALSEWWQRQRDWAEGPNPWTSPVVERCLLGFKRVLGPAERKERAARPTTMSIGPDTLQRLAPHLDSLYHGDGDLMVWAAANLAAHGLLRPNEFVGAYRNEDRALTPDQIVFYTHLTRLDAIAPHALWTQGPQPVRLVIRLDATKADQDALNPPHEITAASAVSAMWRWCNRRLVIGAQGPQLFRMPGERPLSIRTLCDRLQEAAARAGLGTTRITGRCFRRGGCSELVAAGAPQETIQRAGRWKSAAMVRTYADAAALARRARAAAEGQAAPLR
jgi:hypothetical protein